MDDRTKLPLIGHRVGIEVMVSVLAWGAEQVDSPSLMRDAII